MGRVLDLMQDITKDEGLSYRFISIHVEYAHVLYFAEEKSMLLQFMYIHIHTVH